MTDQELSKYLGKYVSFDLAITPPLWLKDKNVDTNNHMEGVLVRNNGSLSHFALDYYDNDNNYYGIAIRDAHIGLIINFKVIDKGEA